MAGKTQAQFHKMMSHEIDRVAQLQEDGGRSGLDTFHFVARPGHPAKLRSHPARYYQVFGRDTVSVTAVGFSDFCVHVSNPKATSLPHGLWYDSVHNTYPYRSQRPTGKASACLHAR